MKRVCVFTGSSPGARPEYAVAARTLGALIAERSCALVYGGANVGLMGVLADSVLAAGGEVVGVIPEGVLEREVAHRGLSELHVVTSMHERKATMAALSDAVIALPGGLGTLDELFEMLSWAQLGIHAKPCGLLNVHGYFDELLAFLDHAVHERFVSHAHRHLLVAESDPCVLLDRMTAYVQPVGDKWIDRALSNDGGVKIRAESATDAAAVRALHESAFETPAEADLVAALREQARPIVSLVAELRGAVAGHVMFSPVTLPDHDDLLLMGLAPMAVSSERQRTGIGGALVRAGLDACAALGAGAVVVLGHPWYYPRFGFTDAARFGIGCRYDAPPGAFMAIELRRGHLGAVSGTVRYHPAFDALGAAEKGDDA